MLNSSKSAPGTSPDDTERRMQSADDVPVACHEIDTEGVIREVNQAECELLGYRRDELLGHPVWEFVAPDQRGRARAAIERKVSREQTPALFEREYRRGDGTYIFLEIREKLIENAQGKVVGIRSVLLDVTERHNFDAEVRRSYDRLRLLLESWPRAIVVADPLGNVDLINPAAERLTGWDRQDAVGRAIEEICRLRDESGEALDLISCIRSESAMYTLSKEARLADRSGADHQIGGTASSICDEKGVVVGVALVFE
jgi:PAS domain S-box-containing protein